MKERPSVFEWVAFYLFILLEIAIFGLRLISPTAEFNRLENVLFSTFEIVFSLYIGYFIQRVDSIRQFEESLKQYGLSAYRRVMDISRSIERTITQIDRLSVNYPKDRTSDIDVLHLMLEGTFDTVKSSISDWGDIIGEEIGKKERADQLQEELAKNQDRANLSREDKHNIEELRKELNKINSELPWALRGDMVSELSQQIETQVSSNLFFHAVVNIVNRDKCLTLYIKLNPDRSPETLEGIVDSQPIFLHVSNTGVDRVRGFIYDENKAEIGEVINGLVAYDEKYYFPALQLLLDHLDARDKESSIPMYKFTNLKYAGITKDDASIILEWPVNEIPAWG